MKKLGDTEFEIMKILWEQTAPVTAKYIFSTVPPEKNWKLAGLMTMLTRLGQKGFVLCDRTTGTNLYAATITEETYQTYESNTFLEKLFGNSVQKLVAKLCDSNKLSKQDMIELRDYLETCIREKDE